MAVRPEFRWWILTLVLVAILVGISLLAMDRPNVVWREGHALCPQCRSSVQPFSSRCATCSEPFDWYAAPDEDSPLSPWSLSAAEAKFLVDRAASLGEGIAEARVAAALGIATEGARLYLEKVGRGRCGWCGGTGIDLAPGDKPRAEPCPVCLGKGACVACSGDRRMRVGDEAAFRALREYAVAVQDLDARIPEATRREEIRRLGDEFLRRFAGTVEATQILFWPGLHLKPGVPVAADGIATTPDAVIEHARTIGTASETAVAAARARLDAVLNAVAGG